MLEVGKAGGVDFIPPEVLRETIQQSLEAEVRQASSLDGDRNKLVAIGDMKGSVMIASAVGKQLQLKSLKEVLLNQVTPVLVEADSVELSFAASIDQVRRGYNNTLMVSSGNNLKSFKISFDKPIEAGMEWSLQDERIQNFALNPSGFEVAVLHNDCSLSILDEGGKRSAEFSADSFWDKCEFMCRPSILAVAGSGCKSVEMIDIRGVASGLSIVDRNNPFNGVSSMACHETDPSLVAIACPGEVRVYDIRYPQEASIRIKTTEPHCALRFGKYASDDVLGDDILSLNTRTGIISHLGFKHTVDNRARASGFIQFTGSTKFPREFCSSGARLGQLADDYLSGLDILKSGSVAGSSIVATCDQRGKLSYRYMSSVHQFQADSDKYNCLPESWPTGSSIRDYSQLIPGKIMTREYFLTGLLVMNSSVQPNSTPFQLDKADFQPPKGAVYMLDVYWDEHKQRINL